MLTKLHTLLFGPLPYIQPPHLDSDAFNAVRISPAALEQWRRQLAAPGYVRSGLIVGSVDAGVLTVRYAIPTGYRSWRTTPLLGDPRYVVGYIDGLNAALDEPVDWYGHWLMTANNTVPGAADSEAMVERGQERLLFGPDQVLLSVGERDGRIVVDAYRPIDGEIEMLPVTLPGEDA